MAANETFARDLVENREVVRGDTTVRQLVEWYKRNQVVDYVTVLDDGAIAGIIGRDHLNAKLAGQYGFSMLADKPITRVTIDDPLAVDGGLDLQQLTRHLLNSERSGSAFYHDILVHENGEFLGLVTVRRLITTQMERIIRQMEVLNKQADVLAAKNRELFETTMRIDQSNSNFRAFFETCSIPILILDKHLRYVQANPKFLALLGYSATDLNNRFDDSDFFVGGIGEVRTQFEETRADYGERSPTYHVRLIHHDTQEIGAEISLDADEENSRFIISAIRISTQEELAIQQALDTRLKGHGDLARSVAATLVDRDGNRDSIMSKLDSLLRYAELLENGQSSSVLTNESSMVGDISNFSPIDLIQLLIQGQKTGELRFRPPNETNARAFFVRGRIVHAEYGKLEGIDGFRCLLKIKAGSFLFSYESLAHHTTIEGEPMYLLLNTCAEIDEEELAQAV